MLRLRHNALIALLLTVAAGPAWGQRVQSLVPGLAVSSVLTTHPGASKLALDPVSGNLFYSISNGDIYEVFLRPTGPGTDSLRFTAADHGIAVLQGLCFRDSVMYLCGNVWSTATGIGKVMKGTLRGRGHRVWAAVATSEPYAVADSAADQGHGFAGVALDPAGRYIYVSSGARTHLGEVRNGSGAWPGRREVPLTTRIFRLPVTATGVVLPNDSLRLAGSGYVYASGIRNAYDMAWTAADHLFAVDNSGERDDPEELNWLRPGRHYGYPWRMGGNDNPLRFSPYNVNLDPLVNHRNGGYLAGWFADDPTFPAVPPGLTFTEPVRNYGTVADYYRDPVTGRVKQASAEGTYISSFSAHRSPLGLVFDRDSALAAPFRGAGFVLSFMPGGDSTGYSPISPWGIPGPFVDPSRELVQLRLTYDAALDNYTMRCSNVATGFYTPVDAVLEGNELYVIENGGDLWRITFPQYVGLPEAAPVVRAGAFPNPFSQRTTLTLGTVSGAASSLVLYNGVGQVVRTLPGLPAGPVTLERQGLAAGLYFFQVLQQGQVRATGKLLVQD